MARCIGFVGLGNMGAPMAQRLLDAGNDMMVHDLRRELVVAWNPGRCKIAASLQELGDACDAVFLCLPSPASVEAVAIGKDGLASCTRVRHIIDLSTTGPETSQRISAALQGSGKSLVDAPISGGLAGARAGTLALMLGCAADDLEAVHELFAPLGRIYHVGLEPGMGQVMKLLNNLLSAATLALTSEVVVTGVKAGLDASTIIEVLNAGTGRTSASADKFPRAILPRGFNMGFSNALMIKDVSLFVSMAHSLGLSVPLSTGVQDAWLRSAETTGPEADFSRIVQMYEREAGVEVKGS
jgi:3-hydroxyisobutyrate dehydrogenase-like beta-hydroxyacid dehydrogenase